MLDSPRTPAEEPPETHEPIASPSAPAPVAPAPAAKAAAAKGPPPIPVVAATSHKGDIGVYYSGLGAVTPLATVTVKSRVDGQLMSVRYREGDTVHKGDLLVEIDDGLYQAALTQAEGQLM